MDTVQTKIISELDHTDIRGMHYVRCHMRLKYEGMPFFLLLTSFGAKAPNGPGPPLSRVFQITYNDAPHSIGLLWMRDQFVAETSS
jgi:hypothetical protein